MKVPVSQRREGAATLPAIVASELELLLEWVRERVALALREKRERWGPPKTHIGVFLRRSIVELSGPARA